MDFFHNPAALLPLPLESRPPELEGGDLELLRQVVGGIHRHDVRHFWRAELEASPYVLRWLKEGYRLEFPRGPPPSSVLPNNASARLPANKEFISQALHELETVGAIVRVTERPYLVLPLQVAEPKPGKRRIIVDASRQLNDWLEDGKVKLDHLHKVAPNIPSDAWLTTTDLKSGYYHVRVRPEDRRYLGVEWNGVYYVWTVTFLGLRPLVRDFTKILKPIMAYLGRAGVQAYAYIDDLLLVSPSEACANRHLELLRNTLRQAGWVENVQKRRGPSQRLEFLGLEIDSRSRTIHIPSPKLASLLTDVSKASSRKRGPVRDLARIAGRLVSCLLATGPTLLLFLRPVFVLIAESYSFDTWRSWSKLSQDFRRIGSELSQLDGAAIHRDDDDTVILEALHVATDASATGLAVCQLCCKQGQDHAWHEGACGTGWLRRELHESEKRRSSTHRELLAILHFVALRGESLRGHTVISWTDSINTERIVARGSSKPDLQNLALMIHKLARQHSIGLKVRWVQRSDPRIKLADELSRFDNHVDLDDYGLSPQDFARVIADLGPVNFDLFADKGNARCSRYATLKLDNGAIVRDAFSSTWGQLGELYVHPPPSALPAVIRKIVKDGARGILVVPKWLSMRGWPLICSDGVHVNSWGVAMTMFRPTFVCGARIISNTFRGKSTFPVLAIKFNGSVQYPFRPQVRKQFCTYLSCSVCK